MFLLLFSSKRRLEINVFSSDEIKESSLPGNYFFIHLKQVSNLEYRPYSNQIILQEHYKKNNSFYFCVTCFIYLEEMLQISLCVNYLKQHYIVTIAFMIRVVYIPILVHFSRNYPKSRRTFPVMFSLSNVFLVLGTLTFVQLLP